MNSIFAIRHYHLDIYAVSSKKSETDSIFFYRR